MLPFRTISFTFSFLPCPSLLSNHFGYRQISSKFTPWRKMGKIKSRTKSSEAERLPVGANCAIDKIPSRPDGPLSSSTIDSEGYIMVGSNPVPLQHKKTQKWNHSLPLSTDKHPESTSMSDPLSSPLSTTFSECTKFKRRTWIDLGSAQANGDNHSESSFSSSYKNNSLFFAETMQTTYSASPYDESSKHSHFGKSKVVSANRSSHSHSKYTAGGRRLDFSISLPKFKPQDICWLGKQNSYLIGTTLPEKNKENCTEMQDGGEKERILRTGMVQLKHYLNLDEQVQVVKSCRELGLGPGGFYQPGYADGAKLRLQMMCLGLDWNPQTRKYGKKRLIDGSKPPSIPPHFHMLVRRAIQGAHYLINKECEVSNVEDILPSFSPDVCIVNFYTTNGRLGLHQDRDESRESLQKGLPVVSFSVGDSAEFLYGDQRDVEKAENILLESGDVLIFGGESRHVFHGVSSIIPNSAPKLLLKNTGLRPGRLNLTFRQY